MEEFEEFDKERYQDYLTVGELKKYISGMPSDAKVLIQRVKDVYFEKHGWETLKRPCPDYPLDVDEYIPVWYCLSYDYIDGNLYLTPHY